MTDETTDHAKRTVRVPLLLTPEEVKNLDDWQFANRQRTRSDAIRRLIELGLEAATPKSEPADLTPKPPPEEPSAET
jgi:hypothetical protein